MRPLELEREVFDLFYLNFYLPCGVLGMCSVGWLMGASGRKLLILNLPSDPYLRSPVVAAFPFPTPCQKRRLELECSRLEDSFFNRGWMRRRGMVAPQVVSSTPL